MTESNSVFDYMYVDLDKVVSIYSQLTGGIVDLQESSWTRNSTEDNKRKYDFKIFKHDAGGTATDSEGGKVVFKAHHALLQDLERELEEAGHLLDLSARHTAGLKDASTRKLVSEALCLRCRGRVVVENYSHIRKVAEDFPDIVDIINRSAKESLRSSEDYKEVERQLACIGQGASDRNAKARAKREQKKLREKLREKLDEMVSSASAVKGVDTWVLDGVKTWIDAFLPGVTNVRLYPNGLDSDEHVFGNLKSSGFTDPDQVSFQFTYGSLPTQELTLLGIVTGVPSELDDAFDPLSEFESGELKDDESIERAFRGMFRGFDGLEAMIRTCRYPRVVVHPLLVYREARPSSELKRKNEG